MPAKIQRWWQQKTLQAKVIAVLATLLILQIGLCFSTPAIWPRAGTIFHLRLMVEEAFFCLGTLGLMFLVPVFMLVVRRSGKQKDESK